MKLKDKLKPYNIVQKEKVINTEDFYVGVIEESNGDIKVRIGLRDSYELAEYEFLHNDHYSK